MLNKSNHPLIDLWRNCPLDSRPYLLPADRPDISRAMMSTYRTLDEYVSSPTFGKRDDTSLHVGLLPIPYVGDLQKASVFILMLNPGLHPGDYFAESSIDQFRNAHIRNLRQENSKDEYPFLFLDPRFAWHPGFNYWQGKFDSLARELVDKKKIPYREALKYLAQNLANLELLPYHSKSFGAGSLLHRLPSVKAMLGYVHDVLVPKAKNDEAVLIVTRKARHWDLPTHENIIIYEGGETRAAYLTTKSRGGKAILRRLNNLPLD